MIEDPKHPSGENPPKALPEKPPIASDMPHYAASVLFELSTTVGRIEQAVTTLGKSVEDVETRLKSIEGNATFIKGAIACAIILLPLCFSVIWWSLGERIQSAVDTFNRVQAEALKPAPNQ